MLSRTLIICLLLCLPGLPALAEQADGFDIETVARDLEHPWSMAWLPDGRVLVTERSGRLRLIVNDELHPEPVRGVPDVHANSQAGLFEVLPAEDFQHSGLIYLSLVTGVAGANTLVVVRGRLQDHKLLEVEEVFRHTPPRATSVHYGGRMQFLPDGTLLVTLGDGFDHREQAQDPSDHFGSIVRLNPDGSAPDDNPFMDGGAMAGDGVNHGSIGAGNGTARRPAGERVRDGLPEILAYGLRNVQGIAADPERGRLWAIDHGPRGGDELNSITPGANYGWPAASHGVDYSGARITPFRELPGMESPLLVWREAIAPAGLMLYRGEAFPDWQGQLFIAGLVSRAVHRISVADDGGTLREEERLFTHLNRRMRSVRAGPDGAIYLLTDHGDGEVLRVTPRD